MRIGPIYATFGNSNKPTKTVEAQKGSFYLGAETTSSSINNPTSQNQYIKKVRLLNPQDGVKVLEHLHNQGLGTQETFSLLAEFKNKIGDFNGAIDAGIEAYKINPDITPELHLQFGDAYTKLKDPRSAIKEYTQAIKKNPQYIEALVARAEVYASSQLFSSSIKDFTDAIKLLEAKEQILKAVKTQDDNTQELKELKSQIIDIYTKRGIARYKYRQAGDALSDFTAVLERAPKNLRALDYSILINQEWRNFPQVQLLATRAKNICEKLRLEAASINDKPAQEKYNVAVKKYLKILKETEQDVLEKQEREKLPASYYKCII